MVRHRESSRKARFAGEGLAVMCPPLVKLYLDWRVAARHWPLRRCNQCTISSLAALLMCCSSTHINKTVERLLYNLTVTVHMLHTQELFEREPMPWIATAGRPRDPAFGGHGPLVARGRVITHSREGKEAALEHRAVIATDTKAPTPRSSGSGHLRQLAGVPSRWPHPAC